MVLTFHYYYDIRYCNVASGHIHDPFAASFCRATVTGSNCPSTELLMAQNPLVFMEIALDGQPVGNLVPKQVAKVVVFFCSS